MKVIKLFSVLTLFIGMGQFSFAQAVKETIKVSGNCGMCKNKIEKAAKTAGATYAAWDADTKLLTVEYQHTSSNNAKIQKAVAATGYDTKDVKASDEAYNNLHGCCKYERTGHDHATAAKDACCADKECCKDGKCADCKDGKCADCCKDGKCTGCKEGACTMEGHNGKDCCKKS
ncbi:MAG: cation transporter [Chitinophagaceae bacterium]|nr:cation transporter [Chitinophagaceae bacterium]